MKEDILEIEKKIKENKEFLNTKLAEKRHLEAVFFQVDNKVTDLNQKLDIYNKVRILLNQSADHGRKQAQKQIEMLVTRALQYIFDDNHYFKIEFVEKNNRMEAEFYVVSVYNGLEVKTKPEDSRGGGIVDVVSLALRIALLETYRPNLLGPLILDEPGKHISEEYIMKVASFLKSINSNFKRQIIMVTHNTHLSETADLSLKVELKNGISWIKTGY